MKITSQQAEKILKGDHVFTQLGFAMMVTRLKSRYTTDPSPSTVQACTLEINSFLDKYQSIMDKDYTIITKM